MNAKDFLKQLDVNSRDYYYGYEGLLVAIVKQSVKDYVIALKKGNKKEQKSIINFYKSKWFSDLIETKPDNFLKVFNVIMTEINTEMNKEENKAFNEAERMRKKYEDYKNRSHNYSSDCNVYDD